MPTWSNHLQRSPSTHNQSFKHLSDISGSNHNTIFNERCKNKFNFLDWISKCLPKHRIYFESLEIVPITRAFIVKIRGNQKDINIAFCFKFVVVYLAMYLLQFIFTVKNKLVAKSSSQIKSYAGKYILMLVLVYEVWKGLTGCFYLDSNVSVILIRYINTFSYPCF